MSRDLEGAGGLSLYVMGGDGKWWELKQCQGIEKAWAYFKAEVVGRRPRTEKGFYDIMQSVWMGLEASTLGTFIDELPTVMSVVHDAPHRQVQW